jgi:farnesyl-diphosphate farnesyltransferase
VKQKIDHAVLKGVSRSFYLSLSLLPREMRPATSLAYMLARTSDTLADTASAPFALRRESLLAYEDTLMNGTDLLPWAPALLAAVSDPQERKLLSSSQQLLTVFDHTASDERALIRETLGQIISGQKLDLEHFATASGDQPVAFFDDLTLENYAACVAGSVGIFWTRLGFLTLGERFSKAPAHSLIDLGMKYGKGLQLVNILRDVPIDLSAGRCYLPVVDPRDQVVLMQCHQRWLVTASEWVAAGRIYAASMESRSLRAATLLPALLAEKTLELLRDATWKSLQTPIKIRRRVVYQSLLKAFW